MSQAIIDAPPVRPEAGSTLSRAGVLYAFAAYIMWGFMPLLFAPLKPVSPVEILATRIVVCLGIMMSLLLVTGRFGEAITTLRRPIVARRLAISTVLIAINWFVYIHGVVTSRTVETSLGYFINPLLNGVLGVLFFGERLRPLQIVAFALAAASVAVLVATSAELPWIAFVLALSFSLYGAVRKTVPVDGLIGLSGETALLAPLSAGYLVYLLATTGLSYGQHGVKVDVLLATSGIITALPLLCFGQAARLIPLTTLGFIQYLSPTLQLLLAVFWLGEAMPTAKLLCFATVWTALAIYTFDLIRHSRLRQ